MSLLSMRFWWRRPLSCGSTPALLFCLLQFPLGWCWRPSDGKRRSERTLLSKLHRRLLTRATLRHYPDTLLDSMIAMSATYTTLAYSIFTFGTAGSKFLADLLPETLSSPKWALLTVPLVIYGVARYLYIIYEKKEGESPEKVILTDLPILGTVVAWILASFVILYLI
jgi:hypothetical protein